MGRKKRKLNNNISLIRKSKCCKIKLVVNAKVNQMDNVTTLDGVKWNTPASERRRSSSSLSPQQQSLQQQPQPLPHLPNQPQTPPPLPHPITKKLNVNNRYLSKEELIQKCKYYKNRVKIKDVQLKRLAEKVQHLQQGIKSSREVEERTLATALNLVIEGIDGDKFDKKGNSEWNTYIQIVRNQCETLGMSKHKNILSSIACQADGYVY